MRICRRRARIISRGRQPDELGHSVPGILPLLLLPHARHDLQADAFSIALDDNLGLLADLEPVHRLHVVVDIGEICSAKSHNNIAALDAGFGGGTSLDNTRELDAFDAFRDVVGNCADIDVADAAL